MPRGSLRLTRDRRASATEDVLLGDRDLERVATGSVDPDHVGAEVSEEHPGERAGTDADQLDDAYACKGTCRLSHCVIVTVPLSRFK